jgi:polysaccharide deacetylase 2 family uncharacterized protein YibQ
MWFLLKIMFCVAISFGPIIPFEWGFAQPVGKPPSKVAIIIDDLGNGLKGTEEIFSIQSPLTVAIMPFLKTSKQDAIRAHKAGFEVLLHIPMEPVRGKKSWLGPGAITTDMSDQAIKDLLRKEINSIPYVVGVNNHMGSKATADPRVVRDILEVLKEKRLFIVDSGTSTNSKILSLAKQMGVPCVKRTVFLDNQNSRTYIQQQFKSLVKIAHHQGWGVGIGHVGLQGLNTSEVLQTMLPHLKQEGISVVKVSEIVK